MHLPALPERATEDGSGPWVPVLMWKTWKTLQEDTGVRLAQLQRMKDLSLPSSLSKSAFQTKITQILKKEKRNTTKQASGVHVKPLPAALTIPHGLQFKSLDALLSILLPACGKAAEDGSSV